MKYAYCSNELKEQLKNQQYCIQGRKFIKKAREGIAMTLELEHVREKLTPEYYSFINEILINITGFKAVVSKYYPNYKTLYDWLAQKSPKRDEVLAKIIAAMFELERFGFDYYDLHSKNVLVHEDSIKIVDMDSIQKVMPPISQICLRQNILNLLFETFIFYDMPYQEIEYLQIILKVVDMAKYFSSDFNNYIEGILNRDKAYFSKDVTAFLPELKDEERNEEIRHYIYSIDIHDL